MSVKVLLQQQTNSRVILSSKFTWSSAPPPVGAGSSKSGTTELLRELNSLSSSAFYVGFMRFFEDFVPKKAAIDGYFLFLTCISAQSLPKKRIAVLMIGGSLGACDSWYDRVGIL